MIGVYFDGRLGNQFFRYAFARAIRKERGEKDDFVFNFNTVYQRGSISEGFEDELKYFNVLPYRVSEGNLMKEWGGWMQKMVYAKDVIKHRLNGKPHSLNELHHLDAQGIIYSREDETDLEIECPQTSNVFLNGKFEVPDYFSSIQDILLHEFTPKFPEKIENRELYDAIRSTNSVCISIRRGDFISNKEIVNDFFVCDRNYFEHAMEKAKQLIDHPTFIFFSDDIDWVKKNIPVDVPAYYESGLDPIWEKMRLMYSCKHFIISNSTFSWWAQFLGSWKDKVVISPDRWWNNPDWHSYLLAESFVKVK